MKRIIFLTVALLIGNTLPAGAQLIHSANVTVDMVSDVLTLAPRETFWVGLKLEMDEGWHTYWRNSGDSGMPTSVRWDLPEGFKAGGIHWPVPQKFNYSDGLTGYGYEGEVILLTELTAPAKLEAGGEVTIRAKVKWLSCAEICVPGSSGFAITFRVGDGDPEIRDDVRALFDAQREKWPVKNADWDIEASGRENDFMLRLISRQGQKNIITSVEFFPYRNDLIDHAARQEFIDDDSGTFTLILIRANLSNEWVQNLTGVLVMNQIAPIGEKTQGIYVDIPVFE